MKSGLKKLSIYGCMAAALVFLVLILLMLCPWFNINNKTITGIDSLTEDTILKAVGLDGASVNIFAFNSAKAKKELKKNPYVESVKITKKLPDTILITVTERKIRGYVPYLKNYLYIDDEGRVIDVQSSYTKPRPIVKGLEFNTFTLGEQLPVDNKEAFNTIVELSKLITKYELLDSVVEVNVTNAEDIHLYINKVDIYFGDFSDSNEKISYLTEIIKTIPEDDRGSLHLENIKNEAPRFEYLT